MLEFKQSDTKTLKSMNGLHLFLVFHVNLHDFHLLLILLIMIKIKKYYIIRFKKYIISKRLKDTNFYKNTIKKKVCKKKRKKKNFTYI